MKKDQTSIPESDPVPAESLRGKEQRLGRALDQARIDTLNALAPYFCDGAQNGYLQRVLDLTKPVMTAKMAWSCAAAQAETR